MLKIMRLILLLVLSNSLYAQAATIPHKDIPISAGLQLTTKTKQEKDTITNYSIDVTYPQLSGAHLTPAAKHFNQMIASMVDDDMTQFKMQIVNVKLNQSALADEKKINTLIVDYDAALIKPNQQAIVSIRLSDEVYFAGTAHPVHTQEVVNYNLSSDHDLSLADFFKPGSQYLTFLSHYSENELKKKITDLNQSGTQPKEQNYALWNLLSNGLRITFKEYQVAPYYYGYSEVVIPYSALQPLLAPASLLMPCAKDNHC